MNNLIKEAIADANAIQSAAEERAKSMLIKEFSPRIKSALASLINEDGISTGSDQPGGYSPETDKDAIGAGVPAGQSSEDMLDKGDGPEKIQEDDDLPIDDKEEPVLEGDDMDADDEFPIAETFPPTEEPTDDDDSVLEIVDDPSIGGEDEIPGDTGEVPPSVDEEFPPIDDEEPKMEMYEALRRKYRKLAYENKALKEAVRTLHSKFGKIDLFNAKLAYAFKAMSKPGLTRENKRQIAEAFDSAKTVREAQLIYKTLKNQVPASNRKPLVNKNVKSVISESTKVTNGQYGRLNELAGL